jgi:hypothetical protein
VLDGAGPAVNEASGDGSARFSRPESVSGVADQAVPGVAVTESTRCLYPESVSERVDIAVQGAGGDGSARFSRPESVSGVADQAVPMAVSLVE